MQKNKDTEYDWIFKLLIIGDSGVGKTNILLRFCDDKFATSHLATMGIDFKTKKIEVDDKKIKLQVWDTAGQERFRQITQNYYKGAMGVIMTYSIDDKESFNSIEMWMRQIRQQASQNVTKILVGNKCDMESARRVTFDEGKQLADSFNIRFFETSAKADININDAFQCICKEIKEKIKAQPDTLPGKSDNIQLTNSKQGDKSSKKTSCC